MIQVIIFLRWGLKTNRRDPDFDILIKIIWHWQNAAIYYKNFFVRKIYLQKV